MTNNMSEKYPNIERLIQDTINLVRGIYVFVFAVVSFLSITIGKFDILVFMFAVLAISVEYILLKELDTETSFVKQNGRALLIRLFFALLFTICYCLVNGEYPQQIDWYFILFYFSGYAIACILVSPILSFKFYCLGDKKSIFESVYMLGKKYDIDCPLFAEMEKRILVAESIRKVSRSAYLAHIDELDTLCIKEYNKQLNDIVMMKELISAENAKRMFSGDLITKIQNIHSTCQYNSELKAELFSAISQQTHTYF